MTHSQRRWHRRSVWYTAVGMLVPLAGLIWWLGSSKVEMSPDTYEIAIALYRVCNQQDGEGLQQIQVKLSEVNNASAADDPAITHLQGIVDKAHAGDWKSAMRHVRQALADQASPNARG